MMRPKKFSSGTDGGYITKSRQQDALHSASLTDRLMRDGFHVNDAMCSQPKRHGRITDMFLNIIPSIVRAQMQQLQELANFPVETSWTDICQRDVAPAHNKNWFEK
jgi:hypothetical protein